MDMRTIIFRFLFLLEIFIPVKSILAQGDFPLQVKITIPTPYPTHLSDFTDVEERIFINVVNTSSETYQIILTGRLENDARGIVISTNPSNPPINEITIFPGNNALRTDDLSDLFNPNFLNFHGEGVSAASISSDEALPEGEYSLCIRAFDAMNPGRALSPDPDAFLAGCSSSM